MPRQMCTFWVGDLYLGVDVGSVQEVLRLETFTPVPLAPAAVLGLINLRGRIVTAIDLRRQLGVVKEDRPARQMNLILADSTGLSLVVDRVGDVAHVSEVDFEEPPDTLRGRSRRLIRGAYKLQERLLLVLDMNEALRCDEGEEADLEGDRGRRR